MTGNNEEIIKDDPPSYLELAEFIQFSGANIEKDLHQLWRRVIFNIASPIKTIIYVITVLF